LKEYPDLERFVEQHYESTTTTTTTKGPVVAFLWEHVYNDPEFTRDCKRAVMVERKALARKGAATIQSASRTKVDRIQRSFEDVFPDACFILQLRAKFVRFVLKQSNNANTTITLCEFLYGSCALFARRMTEYCLFQEEQQEQEGSLLYFEATWNNGNNQEDTTTTTTTTSQPIYCYGVDHAQCCIPYTTIQSRETHGDPLRTLKDLFPGNVGSSLSQLWELCNDNNNNKDPIALTSRFEDFLKKAEETCLTICGLPFKQLDKKSEKNFMLARKKSLLDALERTRDDDYNRVLELTIMVLYQQIKGHCVFGSNVSRDILVLLTNEKKISEFVKRVLLEASKALEDDGSSLSDDVVSSLREFALSKDVSKIKGC